MLKRKVIVDYAHTYSLDADLERLGDGVIEVSAEELADWNTVEEAYRQIQDTIGERLDAVLEPARLAAEQARRRKYLADGLPEAWNRNHPDTPLHPPLHPPIECRLTDRKSDP